MAQYGFARRSTALSLTLVALTHVGCSGTVGVRAGSHRPGADAGAGQDSGSPDSGISVSNPLPLDASSSGSGDAGPVDDSLSILPSAGTLTIDSIDPKATPFSVQLPSGSSSALPVSWSVDKREIGTIDAMSGKFSPSGAAGRVTITARSGSLFGSLTLDVVVKIRLEGDPDAGKLANGAGGLGGVGGEGGGAALPQGPLRAALDANASDDAELVWLYPYDGTVWPRGLPAPLLQWKHGANVPRAIKLKITVDSVYSAEIYLGPPPALGAMQAIDRLPIPQTIWRNALQSGQTMKVSLTAAADDGSGGYKAFNAHSDLSWTIAPTTLKGVVYYNSYGTKLAENFGGARGGNGRFGGATLAIRRDAFDPTLIAGSTSQDASGCRVCHTVAANGSLLISQQGPDYALSSAYDLRNMNKETMFSAADRGKFGWSALSPDGTIALGNAGPPGSATSGVSSLPTSALYRVADGTQLTANGLSSFVTQAATPAFAPDMSKVAFNLYQGPGTSAIKGDGHSLVVMDVKAVDANTYDFSNPRAIYTATDSKQRPGWPGFLPDASGVVFELELSPGNFQTWNGARGELWWTDLNGHAHALDKANGKDYLPTGMLGHDTDSTLQYEPTVPPIVAGGYAWVVFTSRRMYGNVATRQPFESDPRTADLTDGNSAGPTTKKLWVTAISIPAKSDSDPSHPAFYLPAQELYAGNSRGFWVLDACKENNGSCSAGDECCGGFCKLSEEFGVGTCSDTPPGMCSKEYDKCNVTADCCRGATPLLCIAGRCATVNLQ